jgi:hypothetical protein
VRRAWLHLTSQGVSGFNLSVVAQARKAIASNGDVKGVRRTAVSVNLKAIPAELASNKAPSSNTLSWNPV